MNMREGSTVLASIPQSNGNLKTRPVVILRAIPPYQDWLICGISTQLHQLVVGFDEIISTEDLDFIPSGLQSKSLIRLGFLSLITRRSIIGSIGSISVDRHQRLLKNLSHHLTREL